MIDKKIVFEEIKKIRYSKRYIFFVIAILLNVLNVTGNYRDLMNSTLLNSAIETERGLVLINQGLLIIFKQVFGGTGAMFFTIITLLFVITPFFSDENHHNMWDVIRVTSKGRKVTTHSKITAALIVTCIWVVINYVLSTMVYLFLSDAFSVLNNPLSMYEFFSHSEMKITVGGALAIGLLVQLFGAFAIVCFYCLVSSLCSNNLVSMGISFAAIFGSFFLPQNETNVYIFNYLPSISMDWKFIFLGDTVNWKYAIFVSLAIGILSIVITHMLDNRKTIKIQL